MPGGIIFLDLSSRTGVARDGAAAGAPHTELLILRRADGSKYSGIEYGPVFDSLRTRLHYMVRESEPAIIGFESAVGFISAGRGKIQTTQHTMRLLYGLIAITEEVAAHMGVRCYEVAINEIKRYFTGNGHADKLMMLRRCEQLGWDVGADHNRADAAAGWSYLKSLNDPAWAPRATPLFASAR